MTQDVMDDGAVDDGDAVEPTPEPTPEPPPEPVAETVEEVVEELTEGEALIDAVNKFEYSLAARVSLMNAVESSEKNVATAEERAAAAMAGVEGAKESRMDAKSTAADQRQEIVAAAGYLKDAVDNIVASLS